MKTAELEMDASWDPKRLQPRRKNTQRTNHGGSGLGVPDQGGTNNLPLFSDPMRQGLPALHLVLDASLQCTGRDWTVQLQLQSNYLHIPVEQFSQSMII